MVITQVMLLSAASRNSHSRRKKVWREREKMQFIRAGIQPVNKT